MGVADIIAANGSFSAYFTNFCHDFLKWKRIFKFLVLIIYEKVRFIAIPLSEKESGAKAGVRV
jgi:hypothetical protein